MILRKKNYWLVRTYSGDYYEQFRDHNFIGIGWDEITLNDISRISFDTPTKALKDKQKALLNAIANKVIFPINREFKSDESRAAAGVRAVHQVETLVKKIKKGDIIIIPSENSDYYSFGEVIENQVQLAGSTEKFSTNCDLIKRKKIHWLRIDVRREHLDPNYLKFLRVQSTINNISEYRYFIEKTISRTFILENESHFVFRVTKSDDLNPSHYRALLKAIDLTEKVIELETGILIDEVDIKASVQSDGDFVIISQYLPYIYFFGLTILVFLGGGLKGDKTGIKIGTKGIPGAINKVVDGIRKRKEFANNQEQFRKNQETVRKALELNPNLIKDCTDVVNKLIDNSTSKDLDATPEDNDIV